MIHRDDQRFRAESQKCFDIFDVGWQQLSVGNGRKNESRSTTSSCVSQIQRQFSLFEMYDMQQVYSCPHFVALKRAES